MATDVERLVVQLSADVKRYENALRKAMGQTNATAKRIETRFSKMNSTISASAARLGGVLVGAFAGGAAIRGAQQLIDAATRIENALKVAGLSGEELTAVYDRLFQSAQRNAAPVEALVELYGRAALVQNELKISTEELLGFTDSIAVALRVSGKSASESSGALLQLSQALGSGVVRAEEFNSILEGALPIAQAAAAGLEEAGGSVARLRQLVVDGKVSSEAFFRAFEAGSVILEEKVANAELTVSQGLVRLNNALIRVAGEMDEATGASAKTGAALDRLATAVEQLGDFMTRAADGPIGTFIGQLTALDATAQKVIQTLSAFSLNDEIFTAIGNYVAPPRELTEQGIKDFAVRNGMGGAKTTAKTSRLQAARETVSLSDFAAPAARGGGGSSRAKKRADDYERLVKRINESIEATNAETAALATLNPLVDDYGYTLEKARVQQDLLNAAKEQGKEITPALRDEIGKLSHNYAMATVEAAKLAEEHDKIREKAEELAEFNKDLARGIIDGFIEGKDAAEIFADALKKVGDRLLNDVLDGIFQVKNAAGGGGFLSGLLGLFGGGGGFVPTPGVGLFASGGYTGPGGKYQPAGVVHKGEYVFSKAAVDRIGAGNLEAMHRNLKGYASGGLVAPTVPALKAGAPSSSAASSREVAININVAGARGNSEIRDMVITGVREGISEFSRTELPLRVNEISEDPRAVG